MAFCSGGALMIVRTVLSLQFLFTCLQLIIQQRKYILDAVILAIGSVVKFKRILVIQFKVEQNFSRLYTV
jgi:hypothetical protein